MKLSLCVPTYNRADSLASCLAAIAEAGKRSPLDVEVIVSDNASTDATAAVAAAAGPSVKYRKNPENVGVARNILAAVSMAEGEFCWLLGDDDRLKPQALERLSAILADNPGVDHVFVNSTTLPENEPFSPWTRSGRRKFLDLIDPRISFDFLVGMFLSVFRRSKWQEGLAALDEDKLKDPRTFSTLDNTCPHVKVFARGLAKSDSYLCAEPLTENLKGAREWAPLYPLVKSVRIVEALEEYRKNGLPFFQYVRCRNAALDTFLPDFANILAHGERAGASLISPGALIFANLGYPNFYLSPLYYIGRKIRQGCAK